MWTHRLLLEGLDHAEKSFVTLTYGTDQRDVDPVHLQRWLKRFRKYIAPKKLRFYGVGEYGDISLRPHYHVALYGHPPCYLSGQKIRGECQCPACSAVRETWTYGHVMVARLEAQSCQYIAGYLLKKMTHSLDTRLHGRHPEFARMSLRPWGIGANAMNDVASDMMRYHLDNTLPDVPTALRFNGKILPLGRYLRGELRKRIGRDKKAPPEALQKLENALQLLRCFAFDNDRSVQSVFAELNEPYADQLAAREKLGAKYEAI